jgi:hypothetical protein
MPPEPYPGSGEPDIGHPQSIFLMFLLHFWSSGTGLPPFLVLLGVFLKHQPQPFSDHKRVGHSLHLRNLIQGVQFQIGDANDDLVLLAILFRDPPLDDFLLHTIKYIIMICINQGRLGPRGNHCLKTIETVGIKEFEAKDSD